MVVDEETVGHVLRDVPKLEVYDEIRSRVYKISFYELMEADNFSWEKLFILTKSECQIFGKSTGTKTFKFIYLSVSYNECLLCVLGTCYLYEPTRITDQFSKKLKCTFCRYMCKLSMFNKLNVTDVSFCGIPKQSWLTVND